MGIFDIFRRAPPIRDGQALADFVDRNAAFLVQKGLYEYTRARASVFSKILFQEKAFQETAERARWQAYPLGLAMVAEMTEGVLRDAAGAGLDAMRAELSATVLGVFDRYPVPPSIGAEAWGEARTELARRLAMISLHPRKPVMDIPMPYAEAYFALMPIHERLRGHDFPTLQSYLRVSLCNIHDEFVRRLDAPALLAEWRAGAQ